MVKPTTHIGKTSGVWDNRFEQRAWIQWDRNVDPEVENGMNANSYGVPPPRELGQRVFYFAPEA